MVAVSLKTKKDTKHKEKQEYNSSTNTYKKTDTIRNSKKHKARHNDTQQETKNIKHQNQLNTVKKIVKSYCGGG